MRGVKTDQQPLTSENGTGSRSHASLVLLLQRLGGNKRLNSARSEHQERKYSSFQI